jgi:hypothetical protein
MRWLMLKQYMLHTLYENVKTHTIHHTVFLVCWKSSSAILLLGLGFVSDDADRVGGSFAEKYRHAAFIPSGLVGLTASLTVAACCSCFIYKRCASESLSLPASQVVATEKNANTK